MLCAAAEASSSPAPQQPDGSLPPQQGIFCDQLPEAPGVPHRTVSNSKTAAVPAVSRHVKREDVRGSDQAETESPPDAAVSLCMLMSYVLACSLVNT